MPREKTFPNEILFDTWEQFYSFDLITEMAISKIGNGEYRNGERGTGNGERGISTMGNL